MRNFTRCSQILSGLGCLLAFAFFVSDVAYGAQRAGGAALPRVETVNNVKILVDPLTGFPEAPEFLKYQKRFPKGSQVYFVDEYSIQNGNENWSFPIETSFYIDRLGLLHVTNQETGTRKIFSSHYTITRQLNVKQVILRPGEAVDDELRRNILMGAARLGKVLAVH